jgi:carboxyl-terminal processing protease
MTRFFAAPILTTLILGSLWVFGIDSVVLTEKRTYEENIRKYNQVQRLILDHHVDTQSIELMYQSSMKAFVANLTDTLFSVSGTPIDTMFTDNTILTIRDAVLGFERAYRYLESVNPDEDMDARTDDAIQGIFTSLDPHSIYLEPEVTSAEAEQFAGKFEGIGVQFDIIRDSITVVSAISGGPSERLGIMSGDRIVSINEKSSVGFTNQQVLQNLRGPKGTIVKVQIVRPGIRDAMTFNIERDEIPVYSVDASYMLDDDTGYIKIGNFAATTYDEFMLAMNKLDGSGMKKLILDLRGNPGGYLIQATRIVGEFFPGNTPLVSTKSRHARYTGDYATPRNGIFRGMPLIVLVNEGSASGSEIVAGAIQDHDRGIIAGSRTYGKGLVQNQFDLIDKSSVRITISKYYTPSGRLIQKPYIDGREAYAFETYRRSNSAVSDVENFVSNIPDSLVFTTNAGRSVYGGGGVIPDHILESDTTRSFVYGFMRQKNLNFTFIRNYLDKNSDAFRAKWESNFDSFLSDFVMDDATMDEFKTDMLNAGMVLSDTVAVDKAVLKDEILYVHPDQYKKDQWIVAGMLKVELARQVWDTQHFYQAYNLIFDSTLREAVTLWPEVQELKAVAERTSLRRN